MSTRKKAVSIVIVILMVVVVCSWSSYAALTDFFDGICYEQSASDASSPDGRYRAAAQLSWCGPLGGGSAYVTIASDSDSTTVFSYSGSESDIELVWMSNSDLLIRYPQHSWTRIHHQDAEWNGVRVQYDPLIVEMPR